MGFHEPRYAQKLKGEQTTIGKTLTADEYAKLLLLLPYAGFEMLTDTEGRAITNSAGRIIYGDD